MHSSQGKESTEENALTRLDWTFCEVTEIEHLCDFITVWAFLKLFWSLSFGSLGFCLMFQSDFYKMMDEKDFNQDNVESFHFVPFIACAHVFSISK